MSVRVLVFGVLASLLLITASPTAEPSPPQPHRVNLQGDQIPLNMALKQLGFPVANQTGDDPNLKLDLRGATFWEALDTVAQAAQARVSIAPTRKEIALVKRARPDSTRISHSGPFRIALKRISISRDLETGSHTAVGAVEVAWEPTLQPFYLETRPQNLVVKDPQGKPLPGVGGGSSVAPVDGRMALLFETPLPAPPRAVPNLGLMEGHFSAIAPSKMLAFRFASLDELANAPANAAVRQQTQAGITCRVGKVTLSSDRWTIQMILDTPPGHQLETHQSWLINNELALVSKDGKQKLTASSDVVERTGPPQAVVSYHFTGRQLRGKPEDWSVTYTTPAGIVVLPVPFRFTDIPLP